MTRINNSSKALCELCECDNTLCEVEAAQGQQKGDQDQDSSGPMKNCKKSVHENRCINVPFHASDYRETRTLICEGAYFT